MRYNRGFVFLISVLALSLMSTNRMRAQDFDISEIFFQGVERKYLLHKPSNQTDALPLVIALHGLNQTIESLLQ